MALWRAIVEAGHSLLFFTSATALLAALTNVETTGHVAERLLFFSQPKLLIMNELGYLSSSNGALSSARGSWRRGFSNACRTTAHTLLIQGQSYRRKQKKKGCWLERPGTTAGRHQTTGEPRSRGALAGKPARADHKHEEH
jgi:hypothetical protein